VHREIVAGVRDPGEAAMAVKFAFAENALHNARLRALYALSRFRTRAAPACGWQVHVRRSTWTTAAGA
jgi:hypothetical protein